MIACICTYTQLHAYHLQEFWLPFCHIIARFQVQRCGPCLALLAPPWRPAVWHRAETQWVTASAPQVRIKVIPQMISGWCRLLNDMITLVIGNSKQKVIN